MSAEQYFTESLLNKLTALEDKFQQLASNIKQDIAPKVAAESLHKTIHSKIEQTIEIIKTSSTHSSDNLDALNHRLLLDLLSTIKSHQTAINQKSKNDLNLLAQQKQTREQLLKIIDDIVSLNHLTEPANEATANDYNTDYDELAKEIRQIIRSTPKLEYTASRN